MFYSHEILTSREGGIATVWLVATLGSAAKHRRITRKSILEVDVPKACHVIIQPEAPMALRLQGSLLCGVVRVLNRQYEYVLSDAQLIQTHIRTLLKAVRTSEIDLNAGKATPGQLVVHDDPAFLPDFTLPGLDIDLSALGISSDESSRRSSILSPRSQQSSLSSVVSNEASMLGLIVPSSDIGGTVHVGDPQVPVGNPDSAMRATWSDPSFDDGEDFNVDPGFIVDDDGNLIENVTDAPPVLGQNIRIGSDSETSARVRQELRAGLRARLPEQDSDRINPNWNTPIFEDDNLLLPEANPLPKGRPETDTRKEHEVAVSQQETDQGSPIEIQAPVQPRKRRARPLPVDARSELHTSDYVVWKTTYLARMRDAKRIKKRKVAPLMAKKIAAAWAGGLGIGEAGALRGRANLKSPLAKLFSGPALVQALVGSTVLATQKRVREDEDSEGSGRDVQRARKAKDDGKTWDIDELVQDDDGPLLPGSEDIEIGRRAQASLEDPSFPWNITTSAIGSRQGSIAHSRGYASSIGGFPTSVGGPGSATQGLGAPRPGSMERRGSRITSASPLIGHGRQSHRYSSLEVSSVAGGNIVSEAAFGEHAPNSQTLEEFEMYGPGAAVDTQTAAESQWVQTTLTLQAGNFLAFVKNEIDTRTLPALLGEEREGTDGEASDIHRSILFEELLPPDQHSKIVAAQALHHALALASACRLLVDQRMGFGPIKLSMPEKPVEI